MSVAIPQVINALWSSNPEGSQPCCNPSRVVVIGFSFPVVSSLALLNHRLMAGIPTG